LHIFSDYYPLYEDFNMISHTDKITPLVTLQLDIFY